ncbi:hypothetical protein ACIPYQ_09900 [Streptomyces sp. NPDC090045]|uniref:hypothetical protein n=1 Tax=Streptomyces sp. NPDC090045 TaxID=3365927 RepID=UPI00382B3A24
MTTTTPTTHAGWPAHSPGAIARHAAGDLHDTYAHLRREHPRRHRPPAGARLLLLMHSAARDEAHGVRCPGAQYTRLVAGQALGALTRALPGLALTARAPLPDR